MNGLFQIYVAGVVSFFLVWIIPARKGFKWWWIFVWPIFTLIGFYEIIKDGI